MTEMLFILQTFREGLLCDDDEVSHNSIVFVVSDFVLSFKSSAIIVCICQLWEEKGKKKIKRRMKNEKRIIDKSGDLIIRE